MAYWESLATGDKMRFEKGSKVEVFFENERPSGSWRFAEVVSRDDRCLYTVRCAIGSQDEVVIQNVSARLIRPYPPLLTMPACWMPGDVVEVLHDYSWKLATVSKVFWDNELLVRLVGALNEFKVCSYDVRQRQSWTNGKWVAVGQVSGNHDNKKCNDELPSAVYYQKSGPIKRLKVKLDSRGKKYCVDNKNNIDFQESYLVSGKSKKRGLQLQNPNPQGKARKFRAIEKDGRCHRGLAGNPSVVPENIGYHACLKTVAGEKELHASLNWTAQFSEIDEEGIRMNGAFGYSQPRSSDFDDAGDVTSSVGSCSESDNPHEWSSRIFSAHVNNAEAHSSDAESFIQLHYKEENSLHSNQEVLATEIHRLELHAYRCTLEALHASGPLSWEQETMMTNLRISLHISNDEHLTELRKLISRETSINVS
ncbi:OLC1v1037164C3 [Oldenlandia corymbosa var. corymbosa]|uniref:OLC1v1037164C3 n=1 Tax=Oldenlandia corymbosa var. corymbosa TaxID=529605 RepID=A0AAV1CX39_OLDCO|nr:OLC1v1037164C3 [Oldenlandia corymbosa var. corymbosa]